jgi:hypothetical protein
MKNSILAFLLLISLNSFSKTTWIPVELIFDSTVSVIDMQVISYEGDTVLVYLDLEDNKIKRFDCKSKKYSSENIRDKSLNPLKNNWYGQFPIKGENVKLIQYKYGSRLIYSFAKKIGVYYKIWDPLEIPFVTYLYLIPDNPSFIKIGNCHDFGNKNLCFGFVMKTEDFELKIKM